MFLLTCRPYSLAVWGGTSYKNVCHPKKAIRALAGLNPLDSFIGAFKSLNILTNMGLYILAHTDLNKSSHKKGCNNLHDFYELLIN